MGEAFGASPRTSMQGAYALPPAASAVATGDVILIGVDVDGVPNCAYESGGRSEHGGCGAKRS